MHGETIGDYLLQLRLQGLSAETIKARRRALVRLRAACGCPLLEAGPAELAAWRAGLMLAPVTIKNYVSHVHCFYAWAAEHGHIITSPADGLAVPRVGRRLPRPISEAELMAALAAAPARIRPWLVLAGWAGLRAKEIALLRRENVLDHAPRPVILIASDATKGIRERIVPMSVFVLGELQPLLPARGWVFLRADGRPGPNAPWRISHLTNQYLHELGFAATLHQLRHRFGTQAYQQGGRDLRAVQELLGHADPADTAGYAAYDRQGAVAAVEAIPVPGLRVVTQDVS